VHI
jgi:DNA-binding SARP family transcriptional activator